MIERELDLNDPAFIRDPYGLLAELREQTPIFWEPRWRKLFFTRYADIAYLLRDRRLGRSILPILSREELGWPPPDPRLTAYNQFQQHILMEHEAPDHTRLRELVAARRIQPQDDLITALVQAEEAGDRLTEAELIANCIFLLNAGHEASVNGLTGGMLALFRQPKQLALLQQAAAQGETAIFKTAVEELLRYETPLPLFERWVLQNFTYQGVALKQGMAVALLYAAGNRDERRFVNADQLDVTRADNPHLTFGLGTHYCLGAPLARLELQVALATLLRRLPGLHLAIADEAVNYQPGFVIRGVAALPVAWSATNK